MTNKIIVHGGKAHLDEFVACAEALVTQLWSWDYTNEALDNVAAETIIERRDPTKAELDDPEVVVLDVGGQLDAKKSNYDHHQLPRGTKECAMTLFAKSVVVPGREETLFDVMKRFYPWYETRAAVDSCGPFAVAGDKGIEWSTVQTFLGPFEDIVLKQFEEATPENRAQVVLPLAKDILAKIVAETEVLDLLVHHKINDVDVYNFTLADPAKVEVISGAILAPMANGIAIFHDNRGSGLTLLRLKDDPRVDFTRVKDNSHVAFTHPGGFICKTKDKELTAAHDIIAAAVNV